MIKKQIRKLTIMVAAFMLAPSFMASAHAAIPRQATLKDAPAPRWDYIITILGNLTIDDWGIATVEVYCSSEYYDVNKVKGKCELQRLENGSWKTIKTWTESADKNHVNYEKQTALYKGYNYRLKVTAYAYYGSTLLEQATETFDYGFYN